MKNLFKLSDNNTDLKTEVSAGLTTFFTMAYIVVVNPAILSLSGMDSGGVFVATCLSAALGTLLIAFFANLPYAMAPGMGINAFFTYTVCIGMGFVWQEALAMVFICALAGILLTATKIRGALITAIPESLKNAIGGAIGLFIAYIGIKNAGIIGFADTVEGFTAGARAVPQLSPLNDAGVLISLAGIVITAALLLFRVRGALIIGVIAATLIGIPAGITDLSGFKLFDVSSIGGIREVAFSFFGNPGLASLFRDPSRIFPAAAAILAFILTNTFDLVGALLSLGRQSGQLTAEEDSALKSGSTRFERGLLCGFIAAAAGAVFGTSNVVIYIESAAGVGAGGRTGLTALTTGILLMLCIPFASLAGVIPGQAAASALILVGLMMISAFTRINWSDLGEALPAFFTVIIMVFGYSISDGIAAGFIFYCIVKLCKREYREIHPVLAVSAVLFIINFVLMTVFR